MLNNSSASPIFAEPLSASGAPRAIAPAFVARILSPYQPTGTDYLRSASVAGHADGKVSPERDGEPIVTTQGRYCIPGSCYIQSTGHFNAVEFLICYNQLAYVTFGHLIAERQFARLPRGRVSESCRQALEALSIETFFAKQLSSMFILKTETRFKRVIDPSDFKGELFVRSVFYRHGMLFTDTECRFTDSSEGEAEGNVLLAYPMHTC